MSREAAAIVTVSGRRRLNNSSIYAQLVDEEWASIPKTTFRRWLDTEVERDPVRVAERMCHGLVLAGFNPELVYEARRQYLDGRPLQDQLDSVLEWHSRRTTLRTFTVLFPLARNGTIHSQAQMHYLTPGAVPTAFQSSVDDAMGYMEKPCGYVCSDVEAVDPSTALFIFRERFDRYSLRTRKKLRPVRLASGPVFIRDPYPEPEGRVVRFKPPIRYQYPSTQMLSSAEIGAMARAASEDGVIDVMLDQYLLASRALKEDSIRDAFQSIVPLLNIAFYCRNGAWSEMTPFNRTIELGSALVAFTYPSALFQYVSQYLRQPCRINSNKRGVTGSDDEAWHALTRPAPWRELHKLYTWNPLLITRIKELQSLMSRPALRLGVVRKVAKWDIARAIRARHAFAHQGQPLSDAYLLTVSMDLFYLTLIARTSAVESGLTFEALMERVAGDVDNHTEWTEEDARLSAIDPFRSGLRPAELLDINSRD